MVCISRNISLYLRNQRVNRNQCLAMSLLRIFHITISILLLSVLIAGCSQSDGKGYGEEPTLVFSTGSYPHAIKDGDTYYYTMPDVRPGHLSIYAASVPDSLGSATPTTIWNTEGGNFEHVWSPELHKINGKWYMYFEADNGNTDNHHIYVLENETADPTNRQWKLHGPIMVNDEWNYGIHPSTFVLDGKQYLVWSGWEKRRTEAETQCIFIAEMENPWTLKSERVLISRPEYEWERQWINPDGSCSAYPIFVNENPEPYISPDGKRVIINYSASGIWTIYSTLGMLSASTADNLLDPKSWTKSKEPVFRAAPDSEYGGVSNVSLIPSPDGKQTLMLYQTKQFSGSDNLNDAIWLKKIDWKNSLPIYHSY